MASTSENTQEFNVEDELVSEPGNEEAYEQSIDPDENDNTDYYERLLGIFPNVSSEYIRNICKNPPFEVNGNNDCLVMFINHLITYNEHFDENNASEETDVDVSERLQLQALRLEQDDEIMNEKLNILIDILPDADPDYLKDFLEQNHENNMLLEEFIESNLFDKTYKKRNESCAQRLKLKQYTTNFTVENFLKQFPEPFEYFESDSRKGTYLDKAFNFLKSRYNNLSEQYLLNMYSYNHFNLSLTDKGILLTNSAVAPVLNNFNTDDMTLLQEIAFIQNKYSIKVYLDDLKQKEEKELQVLRAKKLLLECQCCYDELKPTECIECENYHIFCRRCVISGTNQVISNGQTSVRCFYTCDKEINLNVLRKVLPESTFEMLLKKRQEAEVAAAKLDNLITCPFCPYQMELALQIKIFICKNPECMKITCRLCKRMNHLPVKCEDVIDDDKGRQFVEEEMSKALIRNCYNCQKPFVKLDGCNKMVCYCGAMMCYICKVPITGYSHFDKPGSCETWQNSDLFEREQVELSRVQATTKLRNDFPDMKVPDSL